MTPVWLRVALAVTLPFLASDGQHRFPPFVEWGDPGEFYQVGLRGRLPVPQGVGFECEMGADAEGIHIDYVVHNGTTRALRIFNRPNATNAADDRHPVEASIMRFDGRELRVDVGLVPQIIRCADCYMQSPGSTVIPAGTTFSERVPLAEPVREMDPARRGDFGSGRFWGKVYRHVEAIFPSSTQSLVFTVELQSVLEESEIVERYGNDSYFLHLDDTFEVSRRFDLERPLQLLAYDVASYEWE